MSFIFKMPLNKFGQSLQGQSKTSSILSKIQYGNKGLKYTVDGNIDVENLKICNVKLPTLNGDAANREFVESKVTNTLKFLNKFEQDTLKALDKKQDRLKINLKAEIAVITSNTDELKKQTLELNKHKTKIISDIDSLEKQIKELNKQKTNIISDLDSLKNVLTADVKTRQQLDNKVLFIEKAVQIIKKDFYENVENNKKQLNDLEGKYTDLDKKFENIFKVITMPANAPTKKQIEDLNKIINDLENNLYKIFTDMGMNTYNLKKH